LLIVEVDGVAALWVAVAGEAAVCVTVFVLELEPQPARAAGMVRMVASTARRRRMDVLSVGLQPV
jgi:hypothetical protein